MVGMEPRTLLVALMAASCSYQRASPVSGPSGETSQLIECAGDAPACYRKASRVCPNGYRIEAHDTSEKVSGSANNLSSTTMRELLITCTEEPSRQLSGSDPPSGAGGFLLGTTLEAATHACEDQGFKLGELDGDSVCQGIHPSLALQGFTYLTFCSERLCVIELVSPVSERTDDTILRRWRDIRWKIFQRYGSPFEQTLSPDDCVGHLRTCLEKGQANLKIEWRWETGHTILMQLGADAAKPVFRLTYTHPLAATRREAAPPTL